MKTVLFLFLLFLCQSCTNRHGNTVGIIGGADGSTSIYVSNDSITLEDYGLQLTQQMRQLAHDSCYIAYAVHAEKIKSLVEGIGQQTYDKPRKVFRLRHLHTKQTDELLSQSSTTKPILIIDEPQSVLGADKKNATREKLKEFKPLFTLLYSATHRADDIVNMVYRLDTMDAYNKKLVKKISVKGITWQHSY